MFLSHIRLFYYYYIAKRLSYSQWHTTVSIWKVGDCGLQKRQVTTNVERATTVEFTTIPPICYIHCSRSFSFFIFFLSESYKYPNPYNKVNYIPYLSSKSYFDKWLKQYIKAVVWSDFFNSLNPRHTNTPNEINLNNW